MNEETSNQANDTVTIPHRQSSNFVSDFASGAIVTGPTMEGLYFITFFCEAVTVKEEIAKILTKHVKSEDNDQTLYSINTEKTQIENFREDKARIAITRETLISLRELFTNLNI